MINVQNITKIFGKKPVLKDLSFEVHKGQTLALLGLSGSGKTTALKIICGLHLPETGSVLINDVKLNSENLRQIRRNIGYVIQDGGLFPHLTARENITLIGKETGLTQIDIDQRIIELAQMAKIPLDLLKRYPRELSGGQRQRIGIMRALFLDPEILLLDEPLGALDPITRAELQTELRDLIKRLNKTVVLVTHDLYEAMYMADMILLLNQGTIVQAGTMKELLENPANEFVKTFVMAQKHHIGSEA